MDKEVILTSLFKNQYDKCIEYLIDKSSPNVAYNFIVEVHKRLELVRHTPSIGKPSKQIAGVRSILVKPYNRIYYKETSSAIYILTLIDNRRKHNRYK